MELAHFRGVDVVLSRRGLYASRHRAIMTSSHMIERKKEGVSGCTVKRGEERDQGARSSTSLWTRSSAYDSSLVSLQTLLYSDLSLSISALVVYCRIGHLHILLPDVVYL